LWKGQPIKACLLDLQMPVPVAAGHARPLCSMTAGRGRQGNADCPGSHCCHREIFMAQPMNQTCIDACNACADACDRCSTACLQEQDVKMMARCIALDIDCAALCRLAAGAMARGSELTRRICGLCALVCRTCGEECAKHQNDHCQACAQACLHCAQECEAMVAT
jgi:hypothetical protein